MLSCGWNNPPPAWSRCTALLASVGPDAGRMHDSLEKRIDDASDERRSKKRRHLDRPASFK